MCACPGHARCARAWSPARTRLTQAPPPAVRTTTPSLQQPHSGAPLQETPSPPTARQTALQHPARPGPLPLLHSRRARVRSPGLCRRRAPPRWAPPRPGGHALTQCRVGRAAGEHTPFAQAQHMRMQHGAAPRSSAGRAAAHQRPRTSHYAPTHARGKARPPQRWSLAHCCDSHEATQPSWCSCCCG